MRYTWDSDDKIYRRVGATDHLRPSKSTHRMRRGAPKEIGLNFRVCFWNHQHTQKADTLFLDENILRGIPRSLYRTSAYVNNFIDCDILRITSANEQPVFALHILDVYLEEIGLANKEEDFPFLHPVLKPTDNLYLKIYPGRLLRDEQFCMIRFGFRNKSKTEYYQDLPLCFFRRFDNGKNILSMQILGPQRPVLRYPGQS